MEIVYQNSKLEKICVQYKAAKKFFGGDEQLALSLYARLNAIASADSLHDIIVQPQFRFHNLHNIGNSRLDGYFSINVKTKKEPWRIILQPLDGKHEPYSGSEIVEIARSVRMVKIVEVSKHYE